MRQSAQQPTELVLRADFDDLDHLGATVRSWDLDFRPLVVTAAEPGQVARIEQRRLGTVELGYGRLHASIEQRGAPPAGRLTFAVMEQGMRRLWWRGRDVDSQMVLVFPVGGDLHSLSGPDFEIHTCSIALETVELLSDRFQLPLPRPSRCIETFRPSQVALGSLRSALRRLRDEVPSGSNLNAREVGEALVLTWLRAHTAADSGAATVTRRARDRAIRACLERLDEADWVELSSSVLCEVSGVGERTLQYAFRERFGLTPAAFLKARKLTAVRRRLMQTPPDETVADVAARFGFWHSGQFAADYRRAFGEAPSITLCRRHDRYKEADPAD